MKGKYAALNSWLQAIQNDIISPEPFRVGVYKDPSLFEGKLFAVFSTVDKQTGVDHYEVAEVPTSDLGLDRNQWKWVRAVSPYLIKNQTLDGALKVRAIDKAGNERIGEYQTQKLPPTKDWHFAVLPYLAAIGLTGFILVRVIMSFLF